MNATKKDYEKLARAICDTEGDDPDEMTTVLDGKGGRCEIPNWDFQGIDEDNELVTVTAETLGDFRESSRRWRERSPCQEITDGLRWEEIQMNKGDRRGSLIVVDCGDFRLCYQL